MSELLQKRSIDKCDKNAIALASEKVINEARQSLLALFPYLKAGEIKFEGERSVERLETTVEALFDVSTTYEIEDIAGDARLPIQAVPPGNVEGLLAEVAEQQLRQASSKQTLWQRVSRGKFGTSTLKHEVGTTSHSCTSCSGHGTAFCSSCSGNGSTKCFHCLFGKRMCWHCMGEGSIPAPGSNGRVPCWSCQYNFPRGKVICDQCNGTTELICRACDGHGDVVCRPCGGYGVFTRIHSVLTTIVGSVRVNLLPKWESEIFQKWAEGGFKEAPAYGDHQPWHELGESAVEKRGDGSVRSTLQIRAAATRLSLCGNFANYPGTGHHLLIGSGATSFSDFLQAETRSISTKFSNWKGSPAAFIQELNRYPGLSNVIRDYGNSGNSTESKALLLNNIDLEGIGALPKHDVISIFDSYEQCIDEFHKEISSFVMLLTIISLAILLFVFQSFGFQSNLFSAGSFLSAIGLAISSSILCTFSLRAGLKMKFYREGLKYRGYKLSGIYRYMPTIFAWIFFVIGFNNIVVFPRLL